MPGRTLAGAAYPGDDGSPDSRVSAALVAFAAGRGSEHAALTALAGCRLLVPVVAMLTEAEQGGPRGLRRDKSSEMALPTLIGADGRAALPAFTCMDSLARWRPDARPVPVPAAQVWQTGAQEASAVVVDVAGPVPFAVDGARLAALAQGRPAPLPHEDQDVMALAHEALAAEPVIAGYRLQPGTDGTDLTLLLVPVPGHGPEEVRDAAQRAGQRLMGRAGDRLRRGIQIAVAELAAGQETAGPEAAGREGSAAGGGADAAV